MKQILIRVSEEEYEALKEASEIADKTVNSYIKEIGLNKVILNINYDEIKEHTKEISELRSDISKIANVIVKTDEAYNADIKNILNLVQEVLDTEKKFLSMMERERKALRNSVNKTVKKTIKDYYKNAKTDKNNKK